MKKVDEVFLILQNKKGPLPIWEICKELEISEKEVRKAVGRLKAYGYVINSEKNSISIVSKPDRLYPWEIKYHLTTERIGREIYYRAVLESTNKIAAFLAKKGAKEGTCVLAEKQTKGRGRQKRRWFSPYGKNLYISIILRPDLPKSKINYLPFLSCLSVSDVIKSFSDIHVTLKWPNDVLANGKKISGTLVELSLSGKKVDFAIVGIGFNVNMEEDDMPEDLKKVATSLRIETGSNYDRALICANLLISFEKYYDLLQVKGSSEIRSLWEEKASIRGKTVSVANEKGVFEGVCEGIDENGALLLNTKKGIERIYAGDVIL